MSSDFALEWCPLTSTGLVRQRNEDAYLVLGDLGIFAVADGMGGHKRGDVASWTCLDAVREWFRGEVDEKTKRDFQMLAASFQSARGRTERDLVAALERAHELVKQKGDSDVSFKGMGTTVVLARLFRKSIAVAYVGDSRIYRYRNGRLQQLSEDHSLLNEYLRLSLLDPRNAKDFPFRNVIMRAIGLGEVAAADSFRRRVRAGDVYLLCTDGLTDPLADHEIASILEQEHGLQAQAHALVQSALERGGLDNITVLLVRAVSAR